jgi:hypothetical protein
MIPGTLMGHGAESEADKLQKDLQEMSAAEIKAEVFFSKRRASVARFGPSDIARSSMGSALPSALAGMSPVSAASPLGKPAPLRHSQSGVMDADDPSGVARALSPLQVSVHNLSLSRRSLGLPLRDAVSLQLSSFYTHLLNLCI